MITLVGVECTLSFSVGLSSNWIVERVEIVLALIWLVVLPSVSFYFMLLKFGSLQPGTGGRARDGKPPLPMPATGQTRDGTMEANGDDEASDAMKTHLKQQVLALTAKVEEVPLSSSSLSLLSSFTLSYFIAS